MGPKNGIDEDGWEMRMYLLLVFCQVYYNTYSIQVVFLYQKKNNIYVEVIVCRAEKKNWLVIENKYTNS